MVSSSRDMDVSTSKMSADESNRLLQNQASSAQRQSANPELCSPISGGKSRLYICRQHLAALLANIPSLATGISLGWTAPAVPILLGQVEDAQPLRLSLEQASWVGGLFPLASMGGALVAGPLAEKVGRKGALLLGAVPSLLGWLLMAFAGQSVWLLMAGRVLTGLASGAASGPSALYCEEIAEVRVRGALGSLQHLMNVFGCLVIYALGALIPYRWFTASTATLPVVFVLSFWWMPESPGHLASRGRLKDAQQALEWLHGPDVDIRAEIENMLASRSQVVDSQETRSFCNVCSRRPWQSNALRGLFLVMTLMFFQQMSGMGMLTFYAVQLFEKVGGNISSHTFSLIMGTTNAIAVVLSTATVDKFGRRFLLLMSSGVMGICLFSLAVYAHLEIKWDMEGWKWIPLASLTVYGVLFSLGIGPIPWFLMAELLPMHSKVWASPAAICMNRIAMFFVVKESPLMLEYYGQMNTYIIFGAICFAATIFVFFCIPETKGKLKVDILKDIGGSKP